MIISAKSKFDWNLLQKDLTKPQNAERSENTEKYKVGRFYELIFFFNFKVTKLELGSSFNIPYKKNLVLLLEL